jgi:diadenosine tetraphosphate (Ap4A) HIT family hydrolase
MSTAIHRRVAACRAGTDPTVIARLPSGWAVMGDPQVLAGYCLLLPDPVVPHLNVLEPDAQAAFLADVARLGQAVLELTEALRINYALFGNLEPALHAHVFRRHAGEPESLRAANPWAYDWSAARRFDVERDGELLAGLRARLGVPVA